MKCAECGSYNTSREGEEGAPAPPIPPAADAPQEEDEWETEEEEEIVGGGDAESDHQAGHDGGVNLAEVQLNLDGDTENDNVLPVD